MTAPCQTCSWPNRETVGMVCQTCGTDYGIEAEAPDAWRDERDGRIYVNRRKHPDSSCAFDGDGTPLWFAAALTEDPS